MTVHHRLVLDFSDLRTFRLECAKCQAAVLYPLDHPPARFPPACPSCGTEWASSMRPHVNEILTDVTKAIANLLRVTADGAMPCALRFEVDAPRDADPATK